jgi:hypothetical protein
VKVIAPSPLVEEAAEVLAAFRDRVVVVGAAAVEVALAESTAAISPTRDVDVVVPVEEVAALVAELEAAGLERSTVAHEAPFTWVGGDLKVQLVRTFHPFPPPVARPLPDNPVFGMAADAVHQVEVAFGDRPEAARLLCANAACLLALKEAAFGRLRPGGTEPVNRDYHDAFLLIDTIPGDVAADLGVARYEVRRRARSAIDALAAGQDATVAAARELVHLGSVATMREAEAAVRRSAIRLQRRLDAAA